MGDIKKLVFLGASTAFYEINELIKDINAVKKQYEIIAVLDDNEELIGKELDGIKVEGKLENVKNYNDAQIIFGIGSHRTRFDREKIIDRLNLPEHRFETLIHPDSKIFSDVEIGHGCIIHKGTVIGNGAVLESFVIATFDVIIGNYSHIKKFAMITTRATVMNHVVIGAGAFIGACSCIADNVTVGKGAMIGLGTILNRNVKDGAYVLGNPPRTLYTIKENKE